MSKLQQKIARFMNIDILVILVTVGKYATLSANAPLMIIDTVFLL